MHKLLLSWLLLGCSAAIAQTNPPPFSAELFSIAHLKLRDWKPEKTPETHGRGNNSGLHLSSSSQESVIDSVWTNSIKSTGNLSLTADTATPDMSRFDREIYDRLERGGYFKRLELPSDNRLERLLNSTFEPEVIRLGNVSVSCSAVTAIKRKNPFCLLNMIFLRVEW